MKKIDNIRISADASIIDEGKFLIMMDAGCEFQTRKDVFRMAKKKPIKYVFLTHYHWDHVHNMVYFKKKFKIEIISNMKAKGKRPIPNEKTMKIGNTDYLVIPTPGHSPAGDDICIYLPEKKILFTGDTCQPQGPAYNQTSFSTPVPYFHDGESYINSLKRLLGLDIRTIITGHAVVQEKSALEVTLQAAERMRDISREIVNKYPMGKNSKLCRMIFEQIAKERNYNDFARRFKDPYYRECDAQGMMYWVKRFKSER
jgi:glyoxylase-like metal-dependent hydrolase (beta-lactamase superfamily II)